MEWLGIKSSVGKTKRVCRESRYLFLVVKRFWTRAKVIELPISFIKRSVEKKAGLDFDGIRARATRASCGLVDEVGFMDRSASGRLRTLASLAITFLTRVRSWKFVEIF